MRREQTVDIFVAAHAQSQPLELLIFRVHSCSITRAETSGPSFGLNSTLYLVENKWSGRVDLNHRPPGPEPGALARLRYAPTTRTQAS
jgi:hypothetical protein